MASGKKEDSTSRERIPIRLNEFSVLDNEFGNIRSRFDSEMKKMEDEMDKFRSEMLSRTGGPMFSGSSGFGNTKTSSMSTSSRFMSSERRKFVNGKEVYDEKETSESVSTSNQGDNSMGDLLPGGGLGSHRNWLQGLDSPLIKDEGGQKEIRLRFDVSLYSPEEIMVKTVDNKLLVHAKHEEQKDGKSVFREYNREFLLPAGTDPEQIRSSLSKDGILTVEAPLPQPALTQEK